MNYYNEIKNIIIDEEIYSRVKDYSKEKHRVQSYYEIGRILNEAGKHYGEGIIKEYSNKLVKEINKKYTERTLRRFRQFYKMFSKEKWSPMATKLTWSHYVEVLSIKDRNKIHYYLNLSIKQNLSRNDLRNRIKSNEYERLPKNTKIKLIEDDEIDIKDNIKNPIIIRNNNNEIISEKILQKLILEDIPSFLNELGEGFCFINNEYKIKIGDRYNYIDLLLYNIKLKCYVVVELKVTELNKNHIGQISTYMNYIDKNIRSINEGKTIGIIICKKDNKFIMEYCSDKRILKTTYKIINI